jgi:hypothetical protein
LIYCSNARGADKAEHDGLHTADGIHLNNLGQLAMAFAILKGLGAPTDVSPVAIDAGKSDAAVARGCTVTNARADDGVLRLTRLDAVKPAEKK